MKKNSSSKRFSETECAERVNKYGTYNIQPTCDMENDFPAIGQGKRKK